MISRPDEQPSGERVEPGDVVARELGRPDPPGRPPGLSLTSVVPELDGAG